MSRPPRPRRLLWRLILHASLLFLATCVALVTVNLLFINGRLRELRKGATVADMSRLYASAGQPDQLSRELERNLVDATFYDLDGRLVFSNREPPFAPLGPGELGDLRRDKVAVLNYLDTDGAVLCEDAGGRPIGYALVHERAAGQALATAGAAVVAFALLMALASVPFARSVVMPLERLVDAVRALGKGDLKARADVSRPDELGELGRAFNDMAERIAALIRSEKELIANVSHELRTPLARIRVVLELAEERPESTRRYLPEIARDLAELERLVDDVLTAARLDLAEGRAGGALPPLRRLRVEAREVVEQAAERFRRAHPGRPLRLDLGEPLPALDADPTLLRRALDNLLDNARKYSDDESPVTLGARVGPGGVAFRVSDRGIGIDEADLPRLFAPFFRTDRSRDRATGGLGLGLTLTKRIVEAHGGAIELESRPGVGTTVSFTVPASPS